MFVVRFVEWVGANLPSAVTRIIAIYVCGKWNSKLCVGAWAVHLQTLSVTWTAAPDDLMIPPSWRDANNATLPLNVILYKTYNL